MIEQRLGALNSATWARRNLVAAYDSRELRPVERVILDRYSEIFGGRVLELGCGAGRLTGHLIERARSVHAIDVSERMIDHCRRHYPGGIFELCDARDLSRFEAASFDAIIGTCNVLDAFDDSERGAALDELHRLLVPGGLLVVSSHNRACPRAFAKPTQIEGAGLLSKLKSAAYLPMRLRNHHRLAPLERDEPGYAIVNDPAHGFALLHYYITPPMQASQLFEHDYEAIECIDLDGQRVQLHEDAPHCHELHYVARRADASDPQRQRIRGERSDSTLSQPGDRPTDARSGSLA